MGLETVAIIGLSLFQADQSIRSAENNAQAVVDQADLEAENRATQTRLTAARQQSSFLNSGLTLQGSPLAAIQTTFSTGLEDINQITSNADNQSSNIISSARSEAIGSLASGFAGTSFGGGDIFGSATNPSEFFGTQGSASRLFEFGDASTQGPLQSFGGF